MRLRKRDRFSLPCSSLKVPLLLYLQLVQMVVLSRLQVQGEGMRGRMGMAVL